MCHCPYCGNLRNAVNFFSKFGKILKNTILENISTSNIKVYSVCRQNATLDFKKQFPCLHSQNFDHCFLHTKKDPKCKFCCHNCDQTFKQFIQSELNSVNMSDYDVPLEFFDLTEKRLPSWVPFSDVRSKNLSTAEKVEKCLKFISLGMLHFKITEEAKKV